MKGLALDQIGVLIIAVMGLFIGFFIVSNILSFELDLVESYFSESSDCPRTELLENITLNELETVTVAMNTVGCDEEKNNVTITQIVSEGYLERLAEELDFMLDGEPMIQYYEDCSPPTGYQGIAATPPDESIVIEEDSRVNLTWAEEKFKICST